MFKKTKAFAMIGSASSVHNNLSCIQVGNKLISYAVVSRNFVNLIATDLNGNVVNQKQVITKISKDSTGADSYPTILQAKFVEFKSKILLVICTTKGVFIFDSEGSNLMLFQNLNQLKPLSTENSSYTRGIATLKPNLIAVGTSAGSIFLFEVSSKGNNISFVNEICEKSLNHGISDLVSDYDNNILCAGDTRGNVFVWSMRDEIPKLSYILNDCMGFASTSLAISNKYLAAAYGNGMISIFNMQNGNKLADISAHGRWINALAMQENILASCGDDCYVRVWNLSEINGKFDIKHVQSEHVPDSQVTGLSFVADDSSKFSICSYDMSEILLFEQN